MLGCIGGVPGTRENALALLRQGELVVCYPGGSNETFKSPEQAYRLRWERTVGFARIAALANVPVVPFAAGGVDETYLNFGTSPRLRGWLGRYAAPFALGLGPLPLPVPMRFQLGAPMRPGPDEPPESFKARVQVRVEAMLAALCQAAARKPTLEARPA